MTSIYTSPPRLTRHLSDHHAVQGEAEYVERHAPLAASHTPPKETAMTTYMQRDGRITSAATDDMPERIWAMCQPKDHPGYGIEGAWHADPNAFGGAEFIRADLCATGQVRADRHQIARVVWDAMAWAAARPAPEGAIPSYQEWGNSLGEVEARRAADRILAALTASPGWQPIETAPRDGTAILASGLNHGKGPSRHYSVVEWMDFGCESGWYPDEDSEPHIYLTHWMPLPAAPEAEGGCDDL